MFDPASLLSSRARSIDISGIRKVFDLGATLNDPINLSIGQPDFPVPDAIKRAAIDAIEHDHNGYTLTQGINPLVRRIAEHLRWDLGWPEATGDPRGETPVIVTSGTSGALYLMMQVLLGPGTEQPGGGSISLPGTSDDHSRERDAPATGPDEIIIPDPYFVPYPSMATLAGGRAVLCDTYPDFRMTAERIEPLITERTKAVLLNSPSNPAGVVLSQAECREVLELCRSRGVVLVSDEIYDEFCFADHRAQVQVGGGGIMPPRTIANVRGGEDASATVSRCPSPAREPGAERDVLLIRGFGKTYGFTGWRLGYISGPAPIVNAMRTLQQYTYVCPAAPLQHGALAAMDVDMTETVAEYARRRDTVLDVLNPVGEQVGEGALAPTPGGAFYVFMKVPERVAEHRGWGERAGTGLFERLIERNVLTIPGEVFSSRDTHLRISLACPPERLARGVEIIAEELTASERIKV